MEKVKTEKVEETKDEKLSEEQAKKETVKKLQGMVNEMERDLNIYEKLNKIQVELKAPKNQYNTYGNYNYRSLEDIYEGLKEVIKKYDVVVVVEDEVVAIEGRFYIKATARLIDCKTKEEISTSAYAREPHEKKGKMDESQTTGSTSSYARKYAMNALFAIDDNKDADTEEATNQKQAGSKKNNKSNNTNYSKQRNIKPDPVKPVPVKREQTEEERKQEYLATLSKAKEQLFSLAKVKGQQNAMPEIIKSRFNKNGSNELNLGETEQLIEYLKGL